MNDFHVAASAGWARAAGAGLTFRPVTDADVPFLARVYGSTRAEELAVTSWTEAQKTAFLDMQFRALSALRSLPQIVTGEGIAGYEELDVRLGWRLGRRTRLSLDGQNLLHGNHVEFGAPGQSSAIQRSVYGKVSWEF